MLDVSETIMAKSDQLNTDDLVSGPRLVKITNVSLASAEQPIKVNYEGDNGKPYLPCKTMRRLMVHIWGKDGKSWIGKSMILYRDPEVTWAGEKVGGIRISHMEGLTKPEVISLTATRKSKKPITVLPLITKEDPELPKLKADGQAAANKGVEEYKKWLASLSAEQKNKIRSEHTSWTNAAKAADEAKKPVVTEPAAEDANDLADF